jgi:beta-glucanase (GH16 family)
MPEFDPFRRRNIAGLTLAGTLALTGCSAGETVVAGAPFPGTTEVSAPRTPSQAQTPEATTEAPKSQSNGEFAAAPSWQQDFSKMPNGALDKKAWNHESRNSEVPGWNNEQAGFSDSTENVRVENGKLVIQAQNKPYTYPDGTTYPYTSGRVNTKGKFSFSYGKIEAKIKMPKGPGTWPAFWLLSDNQPHTGADKPADRNWDEEGYYAKDGELDIVEATGGNPHIETTVHTYDTATGKSTDLANDNEKVHNLPDATDTFHTYGAEVTPDKIVWTIDGEPMHTYKKPSPNADTNAWPFTKDNRFHVILNLAMGGTMGGQIDNNQSADWKMLVNNVAFYPYQGE